jgi:hypothetical protein
MESDKERDLENLSKSCSGSKKAFAPHYIHFKAAVITLAPKLCPTVGLTNLALISLFLRLLCYKIDLKILLSLKSALRRMMWGKF